MPAQTYRKCAEKGTNAFPRLQKSRYRRQGGIQDKIFPQIAWPKEFMSIGRTQPLDIC